MTSTPLLDTIQIPADLRELDRKQLPQLARELRDFLVDSVSQTGGQAGREGGFDALLDVRHPGQEIGISHARGPVA